jgi:predicted nucleic acid-binding protein
MKFIDSNVFVYHLADDPDYGERVSKILSRIEMGEEAATSTLVITQVCSYLKWKRYHNAIPKFLEMLRSMPTLTKVETTFLDITSAIKIADETRVSWKK